MRENMKQQMRDMLSTLGRAEAILDSRTKKRETEEIARLLEDMQASAMAIGTAIEQVEGDGTQTVRLLEDYCELLWQYMVEEDLKERFCKGRQLAGKRGEIGSSLEAEFEVRLEIVFLVCRSRAWKQMERFYHLMKDKADCYVLTASYKEEDASGEEAVMHDESALIPESVKPFGFRQYDIRERKPAALMPVRARVESGRIMISWKSGRTRGWCFTCPFMRMRNWQRRTTAVYRRPYIPISSWSRPGRSMKYT